MAATTSGSLANYELAQNLQVAWRLALHDFRVRYARSVAGPIWLLLTPFGLLCIYGLVFGVVLGIQWPATASGESVGFLVPFFCGLSVFLMFSDAMTSSVGLFNSKRNYVKKSPFPLWVIWLANYLRVTIQGFAYLVLLIAAAFYWGTLTLVGCFYAVIAVGIILIATAAVSLLLCSIGPFAGDLAETIRVALRGFFYSAPVTYPLFLVPQDLQFILWLNPLTHMIVPLRGAIVYGEIQSLTGPAVFAIAASLLTLCFAWLLARVSHAIPDVV